MSSLTVGTSEWSVLDENGKVIARIKTRIGLDGKPHGYNVTDSLGQIRFPVFCIAVQDAVARVEEIYQNEQHENAEAARERT